MKTIRILKSAFSAIIILAVSTICVSAQTPKPNPAAFQRYAQHDIAPRDGWDDNWQKKFPAHTADKNADPDGDGIGNFEEMLDGTDPTRANKKGEIFISADEAARQAEAATKARLEAERIWAERKARLDALAAPEFPAGAAQAAKQQQETVDAVKMQALHNAVAQKEAADKAAAKALLQQKGFPEQWEDASGKTKVLGGLENGRPVFLQSHNITAADSISTDEVRSGGSLGLSLDGAGTRLGVWELADPLTTHTEFTTSGSNPVRIIDKDGASSVTSTNERYHATHVSGTLVARGADAYAKGMAPAALLDAYDQEDEFTELSGIFSNGDPADDVQISNHSYGLNLGWDPTPYQYSPTIQLPWWWGDADTSTAEDAQFGYYDSRAQSIDAIAYTRKTYLPVWSAGNDRLQVNPVTYSNYYVAYRSQHPSGAGYYIVQGTYPPADGVPSGYDTTASYGVGKNVLTVASVADLTGGYASPTGVTISSFSSAGPTDDGRIKPDVSANGETVYSSLDGGYGTGSGTSQAAPGVAGSIDLLTQHFANLYGASRLPFAASLKGLVIHTADEVGASAGPDYRAGWGLMNTKSAVKLLSDDAENGNSSFFKELTLQNGQTINMAVQAIGGTANPIKVTIVWTDPAAAPAAFSVDNPTARLINDVDLRITKPDATEALPWVLDRTNPSAAATAGDNSVDNVEQVVIANPIADATYTIKVAPSAGETFVNESGQSAQQQVSVFISGVKTERFHALVQQTGATTYTVSWPGSVGVVYRVETSTELTSGTWSEVSGDIAPTVNGTATYTPSSTSEGRRFWRVKRVN